MFRLANLCLLLPGLFSTTDESYEGKLHSRPQSPSRPLAGSAWAHDTRGSGDTRNLNFFIG